MKKIFTIAAIAAATVLSASCAKEIEGGFREHGIIAHASLQPVEATKAIGEYSYNIVWEENDKIAVLDNASNKASFKLTDGARTTSGTFQQEGTDALSAPLTAYYPASVVADDKSLVWPATQADVKNISNVPMTASSPTATGEVNFAFKHLGSVLQIVLTAKNGEINVKKIDITADQGLSGAFTVEKGAAVISSTGTTITTGDISDKNIKLSAAASYLNFAVPAGEFTNFKIAITDINDKEYSLSAANLTLQRAMVNKVTFAMDAKNEALYELYVNGHTVKVKLADDTPESEVLSGAHIEDGSVIIEFYSKLSHGLWCSMDDNVEVPVTSVTNLLYTFTLSDISKDVVVTVGYINVCFDMNNSGMKGNFTAKPDDITKIGYNATIKEPTRLFSDKHGFRGWYKDKECTEAWNFSTGVTKSMTLYAKWAEDPAGTINGHGYVKLAGYYWTAENVIVTIGVGAKYTDKNYGSYFTQSQSENAAESWGGTWSLPSEAQWQALHGYCNWEWKTDYNYNGKIMNGYLVTGRADTYESDCSIFLPAAGVYVTTNRNVNSQGDIGFYRTSDNITAFKFISGGFSMQKDDKLLTDGISVRLVSE